MNEDKRMAEKEEHLPLLGANTIFLIGILALFIVDILVNVFIKAKNIKVSTNTFYSVALITEFLFILLPSYLYVLFTGKQVRKVLRINRLSIVNVLITVGIMVFSLPLIGFINFIVISIINAIGRPIPNPLLDIKNIRSLIIGTAVIAGSAGICEEVMFRGVVLRGYERFGKTTALIVTSLLFAVMHRNIQNVAGIFFIGLVIGYLVYRTNSIFAGMIAHFTNNAIVVVITFGLNKFAEMAGIDIKELTESQQALGLQAMNIAAAIFWLFIVIFSAVVFAGLITLLRHNTQDIVGRNNDQVKNMEWRVENEHRNITFSQYIPLVIGLILIGLKFTQDIYYILSLNMPEWMKWI
ncbi:type II CAAX endopeptidase family protein [Petroclostridium xylanilyticum]|uniref:type II CAAX endopeptidase family protein n=1 Tax=Petroclostridium xylanilyticum TaxID=1792311 RepID=UPI000B981072|nr:type II CAAX endopeptidase family protein [Petroclostridium xylanilyticum]